MESASEEGEEDEVCMVLGVRVAVGVGEGEVDDEPVVGIGSASAGDCGNINVVFGGGGSV